MYVLHQSMHRAGWGFCHNARKLFPFELLVSMHIWVEHNKNMTLLQALARMSSFSV